jgi:hypothetical protein
MNSNTFMNETGEEIQTYNAVNLTIKTFIEIIGAILEKNPMAGGYMVRHSKFKGISYNSEDEYVDQFISLYVPPKKKDSTKKDKIESSEDVENKDENNASDNEEVAEEDIHSFSFNTKYSIDSNNRIFYICDPGTGNRITVNSVLNTLNKVISENDECNTYIIQYRDDIRVSNINEIWVNSAKHSIKFY